MILILIPNDRRYQPPDYFPANRSLSSRRPARTPRFPERTVVLSFELVRLVEQLAGRLEAGLELSRGEGADSGLPDDA
jgi:hypothetical protein